MRIGLAYFGVRLIFLLSSELSHPALESAFFEDPSVFEEVWCMQNAFLLDFNSLVRFIFLNLQNVCFGIQI